MENVSKSFDSLVSRVPTMCHIAKLFCDPGSDKPNAFNDVLLFLSDEVTQKSSDFKTWMETSLPSETELMSDSCDTEAVQDFSEEVEELMSAVLMVIQKLRKQHVRDNEGVEKSVDEGTLCISFPDSCVSFYILCCHNYLSLLRNNASTINIDRCHTFS